MSRDGTMETPDILAEHQVQRYRVPSRYHADYTFRSTGAETRSPAAGTSRLFTVTRHGK